MQNNAFADFLASFIGRWSLFGLRCNGWQSSVARIDGPSAFFATYIRICLLLPFMLGGVILLHISPKIPEILVALAFLSPFAIWFLGWVNWYVEAIEPARMRRAIMLCVMATLIGTPVWILILFPIDTPLLTISLSTGALLFISIPVGAWLVQKASTKQLLGD